MTYCLKRYLGLEEKSNMALISIKLPSGWIPIEETIQILKKTFDLKRFELKENLIVLYFDQVSR